MYTTSVKLRTSSELDICVNINIYVVNKRNERRKLLAKFVRFVATALVVVVVVVVVAVFISLVCLFISPDINLLFNAHTHTLILRGCNEKKNEKKNRLFPNVVKANTKCALLRFVFI